MISQILGKLAELEQATEKIKEMCFWVENQINIINCRLEGYPVEVWPDDYEDSTEATEDKQI